MDKPKGHHFGKVAPNISSSNRPGVSIPRSPECQQPKVGRALATGLWRRIA